ncbi:MAG: HD domain-containing protein, partial [Eubacteriales bacterium]|nr:HD domain-containing protein [Eubacteriales bacterium]
MSKLLKYHPDADVALVEKAYNYAAKAHEGQMRKSGQPYFTHPYRVAEILAGLMLDHTTIAAGLLHDCVEDIESIGVKEIETEFNAEIAALVDGVTKLDKLDFTSREERQAESLRKMFLAMAKDIRVVLIKLADRLH